MRIFYLHGWGGHYDENKAKILAKFGDEVYYPTINYQSNRGLISMYANEVYSSSVPTLIVGTSMGGYIGFHIANIVRCPALLINPAFYFRSGGELHPSPNCMANDFLEKEIVFSSKDEEIDTKRSIKYLKDLGYDNQIKIAEGLSHQIPLDVFENLFTEFREKFKDFKGNQNDEKKESTEYIEKKEYKLKVQKNRYAEVQPTASIDRAALDQDRDRRTIGITDDERWWEQPASTPMGVYQAPNQQIKPKKKGKPVITEIVDAEGGVATLNNLYLKAKKSVMDGVSISEATGKPVITAVQGLTDFGEDLDNFFDGDDQS